MCVEQSLADKYIEKNYSKEIKAIKAEIEELNKKMKILKLNWQWLWQN